MLAKINEEIEDLSTLPGIVKESYPVQDFNKLLVAGYLTFHPCIDCGETHIEVLQFHHLRDKDFTIGASLYKDSKVLYEEMMKCVVLCANCHILRHRDDNSLRRQALCSLSKLIVELR